MLALRILVAAFVVAGALSSAYAVDDIVEAIDQARKAYQAGDMASAKQQLDLASQLIGQKNAEAFATLLPAALPGWKAERAETQAIGAAMFGGASAATRSYTNTKGDRVEVSITGDSALLMQFAAMLNNPVLAGSMGKLIKVGGLRAIQNPDGWSVHPATRHSAGGKARQRVPRACATLPKRMRSDLTAPVR